MIRTLSLTLAIGLLAGPVLGQPSEFSDDFSTVATYNVASILAPCYGGGATKYTALAAIAGDIFNTQFVSGPQPGSGRNMGRLSNFSRLGVAGEPGLRFEMVVLGWVGLGIGCPGEPAVFDTTETFTNSDVCLYGGYTYDHDQLNAWHQVDSDGDGTIDNAAWGVGTAPNFTVGGFVVTDGRAPWGVAGVDDDGNGTTDGDVSGTDSMLEHDYKGADGGWGVAGFDDNGINGIDDQGERGWPGSDDTDDQMGRHSQQIMMELRHSNKTC